jgi:GH15 family glucan-1,4-alpha-glucosidase
VLYTVHGESDGAAAERDLPQLEGYKGSQPVRVGNGAAEQRQMDIYGELADSALRYAQALGFCSGERSHESPRDLRNLLTIIADFVSDHWQDLDHGIWEERGPERAFVYSRVMCWVALNRAMVMTKGHVSEDQYAHWSEVEQRIRQDIEAHGYDEQLKTFVQAYGESAVDASSFRIALVDFLPPSDERLRNTVMTTGRILSGDEALIYRYRPTGNEPSNPNESAAADDGLSGKEGSFLACAFWYVSDLALMGNIDEARTRFERLLRYASPLNLYSEELDSSTGALIGNFPQAFTHIGLINAAHQLREAEKRAQQAHTSTTP